MLGYPVPDHENKGNRQQYHANDDMEPVKSGYRVVESEKNVEARICVKQGV